MKILGPVAMATAAIFSGCSPIVYYVPTNAPAGANPRPASEVQVFIGSAPKECPYRELAYVEGIARAGSPPETMRLMREEAAKHGADAMILRDHQDPSGHHSSGYGHTYTAVAVAFLQKPCPGTKVGVRIGGY